MLSTASIPVIAMLGFNYLFLYFPTALCYAALLYSHLGKGAQDSDDSDPDSPLQLAA